MWVDNFLYSIKCVDGYFRLTEFDINEEKTSRIQNIDISYFFDIKDAKSENGVIVSCFLNSDSNQHLFVRSPIRYGLIVCVINFWV